MSTEAHHEDPSKNWLIFFFVCFTITVFAIGLWAFFFYKVDQPSSAPAAHESMILPGDRGSAHLNTVTAQNASHYLLS